MKCGTKILGNDGKVMLSCATYHKEVRKRRYFWRKIKNYAR